MGLRRVRRGRREEELGRPGSRRGGGCLTSHCKDSACTLPVMRSRGRVLADPAASQQDHGVAAIQPDRVPLARLRAQRRSLT